MEFILSTFYFTAFLVLIARWRFFKLPGISRKGVGFVFGLKVFFGIALSLVYTYYYTERSESDIFRYFDDSAIFIEAWKNSPKDFFQLLFGVGIDTPYFHEHYLDVMNSWIREFDDNLYNDARTIIRLNAVIRIFSFGYFTVHTVFMSFLSLLGLVTIFKSLAPFFKNQERGLAVAIFLIPSVLFWGSGVLKEGLLFMAIGLLLSGFFGWINRGLSVRSLLAFGFGFGILLILKFYILVAFLPGMVALAWAKHSSINPWGRYGTLLGIGCALWIGLHSFFPQYSIPETLARKQQDFIRLAEFMESGSRFEMTPLSPNLPSLLLRSPEAFFNVLIRPYPGEVNRPLVLVAGIENLFLLLSMIALLIYRKPFREIDLDFLIFLLSYVVILYTLIGLVTPVTGAIVRYKVPVLPFFALIFLLVSDSDRLFRSLPVLQHINRLLSKVF